jgi:hypothetical protein
LELNLERPWDLVFQVLRAFFDGVWEKKSVLLWCFDGEFVVDAW